MKQRQKIYIGVSLVIALIFCFYFIFHKNKNVINSYFVSVPIQKFSSIQTPCFNVEIDNKIFSMELDLGFRGDGALEKKMIDELSSKKFIRVKPMYGVRGKVYPTNLYQVDKIKIGKMSFFTPVLHENTEDFIKDSVFTNDGRNPSPRDPGSVGWPLFYHTNILIDSKNSKIAFADSLKTLKENGYPVEKFHKVPLKIDRGFVECEAITPEGPLLCVLDTGCTWSFINTKAGEEGPPMEEALWDPQNEVHYSSFKLGGEDMGAISFQRVPLKAPIRIEAILGMDFFKEHLVFIDFAGGFIYFMKNK